MLMGSEEDGVTLRWSETSVPQKGHLKRFMKNRHSFYKAKELSGPGWVGQTLGKYGGGRAWSKLPPWELRRYPSGQRGGSISQT